MKPTAGKCTAKAPPPNGQATASPAPSVPPSVVPSVPPSVSVPSVLVPGAAPGTWELRTGKPVVVEAEIGTTEFARLVGISQSHTEALISEGKLKARRATPKPKSKFLIPRSEVARYRSLQIDPE